jgi:hypothetical protein
MENEYNILSQIAPEIKNPYKVVDDYFDGVVEDIVLKIASKNSTYQLPREYFNTLSSEILSKIKLSEKEKENDEELEDTAPLLSSLKKENPYKVPADYFADLSIQHAPQARVISIKKSPVKWLKYAAAAVFAGAFVTGGLLLYNKTDIKKIDIEASIQSLPEAELLKGIEAERTSLVSTDDITALSLQDLSNLQDEIQSASDEEIEVYLKENNVSNEDTNTPNS